MASLSKHVNLFDGVRDGLQEDSCISFDKKGEIIQIGVDAPVFTKEMIKRSMLRINMYFRD
ncbi:hypothetical protein GNF18_05230 [Ligilactobacillus pobuzihii]|uniref:hypothetical protein n=1 Tax=Ligilactobacillus pobuzihii TaxID=449659 RepID=UPI0019CFD869|nr:hypothetical protein [Ligilactobacillus pobuzihii]MBN7274541.1 hypothetical protein [Ligilactobacillus pobuzihii]